jgi:uncharacterized LabA/DUF88 family protein
LCYAKKWGGRNGGNSGRKRLPPGPQRGAAAEWRARLSSAIIESRPDHAKRVQPDGIKAFAGSNGCRGGHLGFCHFSYIDRSSIMQAETVVIVMDYANVNRSASDQGFNIDYGHLLDYLVAGRFLQEAFCFIPIDPRNPKARDCDIEALWTQGYMVTSKVGRPDRDDPNSYKCDFDVEIAMELVRIAHENKPDTVILLSGDIDMVPAVEYLRRKGLRVEGCGFHKASSRDLILKCSNFIDLDKYREEVEGAAANEYEAAEENDERPALGAE